MKNKHERYVNTNCATTNNIIQAIEAIIGIYWVDTVFHEV